MSGSIGNINRLVPGLIEKVAPQATQVAQPASENNDSFSDVLSNMVNSVDSIQKDSGQMQEAFMNGEPVELHEMMIKMQESGIAMDLLLEVRNKFINAYNEIMRMPI